MVKQEDSGASYKKRKRQGRLGENTFLLLSSSCCVLLISNVIACLWVVLG